MAFFTNANCMEINGGNFTTVNISEHSPEEKGWETLCRNIARDAFHDSGKSYDAPKCHPGTRQAIMQNIMKWIKQEHIEKFFLWLYGPAGAGKTAIANTIAEMCQRAGLLAASFFFSRTASSRNNENFFISTIAYQLCVSIPEIRKFVGAVIDADPFILSRSLEIQLKSLIVRPLNHAITMGLLQRRIPQLIVLDGLDECATAAAQQQIVTSLASSIHLLDIPLHFLVASRPEPAIQKVFNSIDIRPRMSGLALDNDYNSNNDIRKFLTDKFWAMRLEHPLGDMLPIPWPSHTDRDRLVKKASGQFIYAATVSKFIESPHRRPAESLDIIINLRPPDHNNPSNNNNPFQELDTLYSQILSSVKDINRVVKVLTLIMLDAISKGRRVNQKYVESRLGFQEGDLKIILYDMHALIDYTDQHQEIRFYHASLGDFLLDHSRSGHFFIDIETGHAYLARKLTEYHILQAGHAVIDTFYNPLPPWLDTLKIDLENIVAHCGRSSLTIDLFHCLSSPQTVNFFFTHCLGESFHRHEVWIKLLLWLETPHHLDPQNGLFYLYRQHADMWLRSELLHVPVSIRQHLATAMTLVRLFERHILLILGILAEIFPDSICQSGNGPCANRFILYSKMRSFLYFLYPFLVDPERSGDLCVDGHKYALLAETLLYLPSDLRFKRAAFSNRCDLLFLGLLLDGATPSISLGKRLQNDVIACFGEEDKDDLGSHSEQRRAFDSVLEYCKRSSL